MLGKLHRQKQRTLQKKRTPQKRTPKKRTPLIAVLDNIRSLHNVGAVFRTADGVNLEKLFLCGITGVPARGVDKPRPELEKTALGAEKYVPWEYRKSALRLIRRLKKNGWQIVALERAEDSVDYTKSLYRFPTCLIIGNEVNGVSRQILKEADLKIEIPMLGQKESLNVATAFGVAGYEILKQWK